jgi:hypothetical protein
MLDYIVILDEDGPEHCPKCGARTVFGDLPNGQQLHTCLGCGTEFIGEFDTENDHD